MVNLVIAGWLGKASRSAILSVQVLYRTSSLAHTELARAEIPRVCDAGLGRGQILRLRPSYFRHNFAGPWNIGADATLLDCSFAPTGLEHGARLLRGRICARAGRCRPQAGFRRGRQIRCRGEHAHEERGTARRERGMNLWFRSVQSTYRLAGLALDRF
jgi:hypothetical protein